jgi:hypothetical protein
MWGYFWLDMPLSYGGIGRVSRPRGHTGTLETSIRFVAQIKDTAQPRLVRNNLHNCFKGRQAFTWYSNIGIETRPRKWGFTQRLLPRTAPNWDSDADRQLPVEHEEDRFREYIHTVYDADVEGRRIRIPGLMVHGHGLSHSPRMPHSQTTLQKV